MRDFLIRLGNCLPLGAGPAMVEDQLDLARKESVDLRRLADRQASAAATLILAWRKTRPLPLEMELAMTVFEDAARAAAREIARA